MNIASDHEIFWRQCKFGMGSGNKLDHLLFDKRNQNPNTKRIECIIEKNAHYYMELDFAHYNITIDDRKLRGRGWRRVVLDQNGQCCRFDVEIYHVLYSFMDQYCVYVFYLRQSME